MGKMALNQRVSFTLNVKGGASLRREQLQGREHLVAPAVMMVEGVHNGSMGPLYYPKSELEPATPLWNHMPIVIHHPEKDGRGISARDPDVLNSRGVGLLLNSKWESGKQKTECWFDEARLKELAPEVLENLEAGKMTELSTGLFTDNEEASEDSNEWNGEKYVAIAKNHRPDHLAILPDKKGSCSIADGAGLLRNQEKDMAANAKVKLSQGHKRNLVEKALKDRHVAGGADKWSAPYAEDLTDSHVMYNDPKSGNMVHEGYSVDESGSSAELKGDPKPVTRKVQYLDSKGTPVANDGFFPKGSRQKGEEDPATEPDLDEDKNSQDEAEKRDKAAKDIKVQKDNVTKTDKDGAKFATTPGITNEEKETPIMNKIQLVAALIANAAGLFTENDRVTLESKSEEQLKRLHDSVIGNKEMDKGEGEEIEQEGNKTGIGKGKPGKGKTKKLPGAEGVTGQAAKKMDDSEEEEEPTKNMSTEEYLEKAPDGLREILTNSLKIHDQTKRRLVKAILANKRNRFSETILNKKGVEELQDLVELGGGDKKPAMNYSGLGEVQEVEAPVANAETILDTPTYDFSKS